MTTPGEILATCTATALPDAVAGRPPEWVHLVPAGFILARDGRQFWLRDAKAVVARSWDPTVDLPIDYEHQAADPSKRPNGPIPAAGWIKALEARETGIWGRVEWTPRAAQRITAREYRYLSPNLIVRKGDPVILKVTGAGLVHHPALERAALARQETPAMDTDTDTPLAPIAVALGLSETATQEEILATLSQKAAPDPARFLPIEAVQELLADRNSTMATLSQDRAQARVDDALRKGAITPAMRDWALELCATNPDSFDTFLSKSGRPFAHLTQESARSDWSTPTRVAPAQGDVAEICRHMGIDPARLAD